MTDRNRVRKALNGTAPKPEAPKAAAMTVEVPLVTCKTPECGSTQFRMSPYVQLGEIGGSFTARQVGAGLACLTCAAAYTLGPSGLVLAVPGSVPASAAKVDPGVSS